METKELVRKAAKGDDMAFTELIKSCQEKLYRIAYSYVKNKDDALDIVGETVYTAYTKIETLKNPEYFTTWIIRITINQSINFIKKHQRVILHDENIYIPSEIKEDNEEEIMDLENAMDKLNKDQKTVIILKYFEDLTLTQVAQVMQKPLGTVKTYLNSALKSLRLELKEVLR